MIVFACIDIGAAVGIRLPERYLSPDAKDFVKVTTGLIATMAALVLSLLLRSAKASFDTQRGDVRQMAAHVILLDRLLALFGPDATDAREALRAPTARVVDQMWTWEPRQSTQADTGRAEGDDLYMRVSRLQPKDDVQRTLKVEALRAMVEIQKIRLSLGAKLVGSIPLVLVAVLALWLVITFTSLGLFAPHERVLYFTLLVDALWVSACLFLILDLARPFSGIMGIPSAPLRHALAHLGP